jgi:pantoate--beta-alanine ligase
MKILTTLSDLNESVYNAQISGKKIGLCPTMGYLHEGHLSLVERSNKTADFTIVTIFVNRSQFNDPKDFELYPRDLEKDIRLLEKKNVDVLWIPNEEEVEKIPLDFSIDFNGIDNVLEGAFRPGHFKGVAEIVYRLFKAVQPDYAFFGSKDYQQLKVIEMLVEQNQLKIDIVPIPVYREANGLAMSSRNARLSEGAKKKATLLIRALTNLWPNVEDSGFSKKKESIINSLEEENVHVEYLELFNFEKWTNQSDIRLLIAAQIDGIRLIDNIGKEDIVDLEL